MKLIASTTLLLAALALASPAPEANPHAVADRYSTVKARKAEAALDMYLSKRVTGGGKGGKGSGGGGSSNDTEGAASDLLSPSRALQIGALGLGVLEVVRLWG
ncbi:hypothetical protein TW65_86049 [Stemphylium lycopersici]|nr:hypothetical protein TW65_86049 [Stemphylium lycopersici]